MNCVASDDCGGSLVPTKALSADMIDVVGGQEAADGQFPFMVSLEMSINHFTARKHPTQCSLIFQPSTCIAIHAVLKKHLFFIF